MSFDTVACDYQGQNLINEERLALGYGTVSAPHIPTAAAPPYNLGSTDVDLIEINNPTGISEYTTSTPSKHMLKVAPNPARTKTTITFSMPKASAVNIDLINASGRIEDRIFAGDLSPGQHRIVYEIKKRLPSGSYFVRLQNNDANALRKLAVLN
jgi:hypothetical protein